ncbi:hypothetical protein Bbelb_158890 [Branchiostoma belcheri]|nr:hypothetical protein Bbelb_158890 [Branchiostoma belcheri]
MARSRFALLLRAHSALTALIVASPSTALSWRWYDPVPYHRRGDGAHESHGALIVSSHSRGALIMLSSRFHYDLGPFPGGESAVHETAEVAMFCIKIKVGAWRALMAHGACFALSRHSSLHRRPRHSHGDGMTRFHTIADVTALMTVMVLSSSHRALVALSWRFHCDLGPFLALWPISGRCT